MAMLHVLFAAASQNQDSVPEFAGTLSLDSIDVSGSVSALQDSANTAMAFNVDTIMMSDEFREKFGSPTLYDFPYSRTRSLPDWKRLWINTAVLVGAGVTTMVVLESLPADATAWNKTENAKVPLFKRWVRNVKAGPVWDKDNLVFNYALHPYAGAAYFMSARTCGFNFWQSMLYSAAISTIGWEFGIEACMERPSYQDLIFTPLLGSILGEGFYRLKRLIVSNNYELLGTPVLGHIAAFFLDPVNEVIGLLSPGTCRTIGPGCLSSQPLLIPSPAPGMSSSFGFSISATF